MLLGFSKLGTSGKKYNLVSDTFLHVFCTIKKVENTELGGGGGVQVLNFS